MQFIYKTSYLIVNCKMIYENSMIFSMNASYITDADLYVP